MPAYLINSILHEMDGEENIKYNKTLNIIFRRQKGLKDVRFSPGYIILQFFKKL